MNYGNLFHNTSGKKGQVYAGKWQPRGRHIVKGCQKLQKNFTALVIQVSFSDWALFGQPKNMLLTCQVLCAFIYINIHTKKGTHEQF
jgi:hypothetical protein